MLREKASKLLQIAKNRQSEIAKGRNASDQGQNAPDTDSQSNGTVKSLESRTNSLPADFKAAGFTLVKKKQLKELSPKHFLKQREPSEGSCLYSITISNIFNYY